MNSKLLTDDDLQARAKLQPMISCLNGGLSHYENFTDSYLDRMHRLSTKPAETEIVSLDPTTFEVTLNDTGSGTTDCARELEQGAKLPPAIPELDQAALAAAATLRQMIGPGRELDTYLKQKGYLDDKFAHGKELGAVVTPLLLKVDKQTEQLRYLIEERNSVIRQHELDAIDRREGHSLLWHAHHAMVAARANDAQIIQMARADCLTAAGVDQAMQPLKQAIEDGQAYVASHPDAGKTTADDARPIWFSISDRLGTELADTRELRQTIVDPTREYYTGQHKGNIENSVHKVEGDFDTLVSAYNSAISR